MRSLHKGEFAPGRVCTRRSLRQAESAPGGVCTRQSLDFLVKIIVELLERINIIFGTVYFNEYLGSHQKVAGEERV